MPELSINGSIKDYSAESMPATLTDLIAQLELTGISLIAEIDGKIIRKEDFSTTAIADGMKIELIKFVGGG